MIIVDTSVWIDYLTGRLNPKSLWLESSIDVERIGLTSLILCEVLQGFRHDTQFTQARERLMNFEIFDGYSVDLATTSAENFRFLRKRGITIRSSIDCMIASFCIKDGHELLHNDHDFDSFEAQLGLLVLHPPEYRIH